MVAVSCGRVKKVPIVTQHTLTHACVHTHTHTHTNTYMHALTHTHTHTHTHAHTQTHTCMHSHTLIHTHTHMHTQGRRGDCGGPGQIENMGPHKMVGVRGSGGTPPGNFEILHALKCVLGAPEALFVHAHNTYIYLQVAVFDKRFQIEKYDVRGPRNSC